MSIKNFLALVFVLLSVGTQYAPAAEQGKSYKEIRRLLRKADESQDALGKLFAIGDGHIPELLRALDDPDHVISVEAQRVLRYLANPVGMEGLCNWSKTHNVWTGSIPAPISECDFDFLENHFRNTGYLPWGQDSVYALWLDGSDRATRILRRAEEKAGSPGNAVFREISQLKASVAHSLSAEEVFRICFFVPHEDWQDTQVRVLSMNQAQDKALVLLYVNHGALEEKWWHVVLRKSGENEWSFVSISLSAIS